MTISINMNDSETALIRKYADENNLSLQELFVQSVLERIEEEEEAAQNYAEAMAEYEKNPVTYKLVPVTTEFEQ